MDNSILASKYLLQILSQDEILQTLIPMNNIFPLIAEEDTTFPFVVFSRTGLQVDYCKDGSCDNRLTYSFIVVSDDYFESIQIANRIRYILEDYRCKTNEVTIDPIKLQNASEQTFNDAFLQTLEFTFNMQN